MKTNAVSAASATNVKNTVEMPKMAVVKPAHGKNSEPTEESKKVNETPKAPLSIDEINAKAERLHVLREKHQIVKEKIKQLDTFTITHDRNNAQLTLVDAEGREIHTSNPASISKLLKDWMQDLQSNLESVELEIRKEIFLLSASL